MKTSTFTQQAKCMHLRAHASNEQTNKKLGKNKCMYKQDMTKYIYLKIVL